MSYYGFKLAGLNSDSTLGQIREAIFEHYELNPDHGAGCSCIDRPLSIMREAILPDAFDYDAHIKYTKFQREADHAISYVLNRLLQRS